MWVPQRRTLVVLVVLIAAMTFAAGVLLVLEPKPLNPGRQITPLPMQSVVGTDRPEDLLFRTNPAPEARKWSAIVIHHSGAMEGSAESLNRIHERLGLGGLGYHFVLTNGRGGENGQVQMGFRWRNQLDGGYAGGLHRDWFNRSAIGICMVGDFQRTPPTPAQLEQLTWLVRQLQVRYAIPSSNVLVQSGGGATQFFPEALFHQSLLDVRLP